MRSNPDGVVSAGRAGGIPPRRHRPRRAPAPPPPAAAGRNPVGVVWGARYPRVAAGTPQPGAMGRNPVGVRNAPSGPAIRRTLAHPGHARASKKRGFCLACYAGHVTPAGRNPVGVVGWRARQAVRQSAACSPIPPAHVQAKNADFAWHVTPCGMLRHGMLRQWGGTPSGFATHQAVRQSDACSPIPAAHVQAKNTCFAWHVTPLFGSIASVPAVPTATATGRASRPPRSRGC